MNLSVLDILKGELIVSCQAEGDDPFNTPKYVSLFAKAAQMGGACGIRSEGIEKIKAIKKSVNLPIIGLLKDVFEDGFVKITGSFSEVEQLIGIGCDIIAIDGTFRKREGITGPEFIKRIKQEYTCIVLADIATIEEGIACEESGADCVSTTLNGYTPETQGKCDLPDYDLISSLSQMLSIPVFAEGRISSPQEARKALKSGAYAIITGTAITRPRVITSWFVKEIRNKKI